MPFQSCDEAIAAAHDSWARTPNRQKRTQAARDALTRRFEDQVDPDRVMSDKARAKGVQNARKAHMARMRIARARKAGTPASGDLSGHDLRPAQVRDQHRAAFKGGTA
jgi:hypothetical protein